MVFSVEDMNETFLDIYRSNFLPRTYCFLEDPLEEWIETYSFEKHHPELVDSLKNIFIKAKISSIFSDPLSYDEDQIRRNVQELSQNHFQFLASKRLRTGTIIPYYTAVEHPRLPGWVLKPCGSKIPESSFIFGPANSINDMAYFHPHDGLFRIPMKERIRRIAQIENIPIKLPQKFYARIPFCNKQNSQENYFVIAEKMEVLSIQQTYESIRSMSTAQQTLLAYRLGRLIQLSGFLDASMSNIRLTPEGAIAIIDTEPAGFLKERGDLPRFFWSAYGHQGTLEKSGRIGLHLLRDQFCDKGVVTSSGKAVALPGFESFKEMLDSMIDQDTSLKPTFKSKVLSVLSFGVFPLIWLIHSLFVFLALRFLTDQYSKIQQKHLKRAPVYQLLSHTEKKEKEKKYKKRLNLVLRLIHYFQKDIPKLKIEHKSSSVARGAVC